MSAEPNLLLKVIALVEMDGPAIRTVAGGNIEAAGMESSAGTKVQTWNA